MNNSGINVVGDRILIEPEEIEEKTEGGIIIADQIREEHGVANVFGRLVQAGPDAWSDYSSSFAEVGDRVMFAKFGGLMVVGSDGKKYKVCNDTDITAVVTDEVSYTGLTARTGAR